MNDVTERDWYAWHSDYDEPGSDWFAERGFDQVWLSDPAEGWGAGAHRFTATPVPLQRGTRMFRFTGRPSASLTGFYTERSGRVPRRPTGARRGRTPGRVPAPGSRSRRRSGSVS